MQYILYQKAAHTCTSSPRTGKALVDPSYNVRDIHVEPTKKARVTPNINEDVTGPTIATLWPSVSRPESKHLMIDVYSVDNIYA